MTVLDEYTENLKAESLGWLVVHLTQTVQKLAHNHALEAIGIGEPKQPRCGRSLNALSLIFKVDKACNQVKRVTPRTKRRFTSLNARHLTIISLQDFAKEFPHLGRSLLRTR